MAYDAVVERLNTYILPELLPKLNCPKCDGKIIHDSIMGACYFEGWEITLLDTPLLQRLRCIHQLGTAFMTYPSAVHTRFSHTLGVASLAGELYENLQKREYLKILSECDRKNECATVRLAGLLHDIGHTFFSHCSEVVTAPFWHNVWKGHFEADFPKSHEFISYLIVTSDYFKDYWDSVIQPDRYGININLDDVANIIIGNPVSNKEKLYLTNIINGDYDVDKLEYLERDAKTAGLSIAYDKARYFQKIDIVKSSDGKALLAMREGGIHCIEQMAVGKIMLYPYVYRHHKVLTTDLIIQDIINKLLSKEDILGNIKIEHPIDMLLYVDDDLLAYSAKSDDEELNSLLTRIKRRQLHKKTFVFNREYLQNGDDAEQIEQFLKLAKDPDKVIQLRKYLADKLSLGYHDVLIVRSKFPNDFPTTSASVLINDKIEPIDQHWFLTNWNKSYANKKDAVYFFTTPDKREELYSAVAEYFYKKYSFSFNDNLVRQSCKLYKA